jgi:hypothetical protein
MQTITKLAFYRDVELVKRLPPGATLSVTWRGRVEFVVSKPLRKPVRNPAFGVLAQVPLEGDAAAKLRENGLP